MNKFLLLMIIAAAFINPSKAQTTIVHTRREISKPANFKSNTIDENTVVKDSAGKQLTYKEWQPLLRTGNYSIRSTYLNNQKPVYSLVRLTPAEKQYWDQKRKTTSANGPDGNANTAGTHIAPPMVTQTMTAPPPDENTIVKDSAGIIYPYAIWKTMLRTNDYTLRWFRKSAADSASYTLVKRNRQEKDALMATMPRPVESDKFKTGEKFNYFNGKDLAGEKLNAKTLAGKVLVLNFWFIGCPPCRAELPDLNAVVEQYKDNKDVVFVAVGLDQGYEIKDFIKTNPFNYHLIYDGRNISNKYGVNLYPTSVIINKDGMIAFSSVSNQYTNPYWIKKTIAESLAAK